MLLQQGVKSCHILALAYTPPQLEALKRRLPSDIRTLTFGQVVSDAVPVMGAGEYLARLRESRRKRKAIALKTYADEMNLPELGTYKPADVARAIYHTVRNYCLSADEEISEEHIPIWMNLQRVEDRLFLVNQAFGMWELTIKPPATAPMEMPLLDYHIIKYVALNRWRLKPSCTHIIIDESHDLTPALSQILDQSPQTVVSLGDRYQKVAGPVGGRNDLIRQRNVTKSIRVPQSLSQIVNKVLELHPLELKNEFLGNPERETEVTYYTNAQIPNIPVAIWVSDQWEMFEWVQRLAGKGCEYRLLGNIKTLSAFVEDCINLYRHEEQPRQVTLVNFNSWHDAFMKHKDNRAFQQVTKMLENGYGLTDWEKTRSLSRANSKYVVGQFEDSRNHEFDAVMLAPSLVEQLRIVNQSKSHRAGKTAISELSSKMYLGTTRTKQRLFAPIELREFIEERN